MRSSKDLTTISIAFGCILLVIVGFIGKSILSGRDDGATSTNGNHSKPETKKYPTLPAEAFRLKLSKNDPMEIIDLRPKALYDDEHIPNAKYLTMQDLASYTPTIVNAEIIIITLTDDAVSMEQADALFRSKSLPYAFLEGGMAGWKAMSGNTVSIGNPNAVLDRAKVSFKTAEETKALLSGKDSALYVLIDVRSAALYQKGHIPRAHNIPLSELEQRRWDIPSGRHAIVYGATDLETFQAAVRLYDLNVFSAYAIENGFAGWTQKKYVTEH